jgi:hypothetical protein
MRPLICVGYPGTTGSYTFGASTANTYNARSGIEIKKYAVAASGPAHSGMTGFWGMLFTQ